MLAGRVALVTAVASGFGAWVGCGDRATTPPPTDKKDAGPADAAVELAAAPLGLPELAAFGWRKRSGQPAFRTARQAEDRGDWAQAVAACQQALAADPDHLEASWLAAVGQAKLGRLDQVIAPLARAVAGDFAKWGQASLELPGLQPFLATAVGAAWRRRVEHDRKRFADALARAVIVTADGELYGVEIEPRRWHRLTRAPGTVIGAFALPAAHQLAYVARTGRRTAHQLGVGLVDLAQARTWQPIALGTAGPITLAFSARAPQGLWIAAGGPRAAQWRRLDDGYKLRPLPPRTARPVGPWLEVTGHAAVHLHALPPDVTADWDDQALASAIRIGTSNRVVSVPSPGLIDGNTAAWSPDRVHVAFVAQLDDHCAAGAVNTAAFIADASSGAARELVRAAGGIALTWLTERKLAIADDHGVAIHSLDAGAAPVALDGATGLVTPRERPRCAAPEPRDEAAEEPEAAEPAPGDEPVDAGVVDAR
ncbi:MAG TPA: hypothetical protein VK607_19480 [Kofleriaceae bacterium]|nr:hypothetical protein [Kofleriaceae bacterium]